MALLDPRERLLKRGADSLSNEELLAVLLRNGGSAAAAMEAAAEILGTARGLRCLLGADAKVISQCGVSRSKAASVLAAVELGRRLAREQMPKRTPLTRPAAVARYLVLRYSLSDQEVLGALYLDIRNRLITDSELFRGTLSRAAVEPRPLLKEALHHSASAIIMFHTHPSGDPSPSREDLCFTKRMAVASEVVGIRLVDPLILGEGGQWLSLRRTPHWP